MGGRIGHGEYSHLILLCGRSATDPEGCHWWVENNRTAAKEQGYLVPAGEDPLEWPVWYSEGHGGGLWLLDDGGDRVRCG